MRKLITALVLLLGAALAAQAAGTGTISGSVTTVGGTPLNGMCGKLYNSKATRELIDFAGSGTDGTPGHYTQAGINPGTYVLLFVNCGANTNGSGPDFNYTPVLFGGTWNLKHATKVVVSGGQTTSLGPTAIPYGGSVTGTVTDKTTGQAADSPAVILVPPGGARFFLRYSWTEVCASAAGAYDSNTSFQQGVPTGATVYFAPIGWGCTDSHGVYNNGTFVQARSKPVSVPSGGTVTMNGAVKETAP